MIATKAKTFTTMIRKGCMDFNSFPATIALEKVEAKALFASSTPNKRHVVHNSFSSLSQCQAKTIVDEKFPKIEWEDDDVNASYEGTQQGIGSFGADSCSDVLIRSPKRRKLTCGFFSEFRSREDKKGLIRTQRILSKLDLLDNKVEDYHHPPILVTNKSISRRQSMNTCGPQFSSLGDGCEDPNMEKLLQMSFCDDGGDYQVTIIA